MFIIYLLLLVHLVSYVTAPSYEAPRMLWPDVMLSIVLCMKFCCYVSSVDCTPVQRLLWFIDSCDYLSWVTCGMEDLQSGGEARKDT
jgi:hypothetical protein